MDEYLFQRNQTTDLDLLSSLLPFESFISTENDNQQKKFVEKSSELFSVKFFNVGRKDI